MRAGELDRTIVIERPADTIDDFGVPSAAWTTVAALRAALIENTADEEQGTRGTSSETRLTFRSRYLAGITLADRLTYDGAAFNIVGLKEIGRRRGYEITAERIGE